MSRWIVDTLPAWLVLLGMVVVIAGAAVAVQKALRRRYPRVCYGVEEPRLHSVMVAAVGALVAANLFLMSEFANPYIGEVASRPPLRDVVAVVSESACQAQWNSDACPR